MKCKIIFFIILFHLIGCDCYVKRSKLIVTLKSSQNVTVNKNNIILTYDNNSNTDGFPLIFQNVGNLTCANVTIVPTAPYGIVPQGQIFNPYILGCTQNCGAMWQYGCEKLGPNLVLTGAPPLTGSGFRPWVDNFSINLGTITFNVSVNAIIVETQLLSRGAQSNMYLNSTFTGCGLFGTILQRLYDCTKKVINYSVYVDPVSVYNMDANPNSDGTSNFYTLFSPEENNIYPNYSNAYWFVVGCPSGSGGSVPQQSCAWLTPVIYPSNPSVEIPGLYQTLGYNMLTGYQKRLLLSGKMDNSMNGYLFEDINGFLEQVAQLYNLLGFGTPTPPPPQTSPSVCVATGTDLLYNGGVLPPEDLSTRDLISFGSGAMVDWIVPSYPMLNLLTGGSPTDSTSTGKCMTGNPWVALYCNAVNTADVYNMNGFSAINVPGFAMTNISPPGAVLPEILCSSSSNTTLAAQVGGTLGAFALATDYDGFAGYSSVVSIQGVSPPQAPDFLAVRCFSLNWY